ncbi:MAG: 50S ribosomal protein L22 [Candidatus Dadabacteria bacterium]|nr:MAG: 50S ribosomal protein L22 [Candidatus Dadabacteria bacterium]
METIARLRYARISPRKARLVVDLIRGKRVEDALDILEVTPKKAARMIAKTLRSAVANAEETQNVDVDRLVIKRIWVDQAPTWTRWRPRAQGRATPIRKRGSHITVVLDEAGA